MQDNHEKISISEASRLSGISRAAIRKHLKLGRLDSLDDGIDRHSFNLWMRQRSGGEKLDQASPQESEIDKLPEEYESNRFANLREAELHKTSYEALLKQLEYDLKSGDVVPIEDVAKTVGAEFSRIRTRLLALPAEQAPQLFNCQSVNEIQDKLHKLISHVLTELTEDERWNNTVLEREK